MYSILCIKGPVNNGPKSVFFSAVTPGVKVDFWARSRNAQALFTNGLKSATFHPLYRHENVNFQREWDKKEFKIEYIYFFIRIFKLTELFFVT